MTPPEHGEHTPAEQPVFGAKRAAEIAGVSVSTIRRNRSRLEACGAEISPEGWKVPISALVASGLMKPTTPVDNHTESEKGAQNGAQGHSGVRELERQVVELRHRAELAEERQRSAEEKARAARELAEALSETLSVERRMLTAAPGLQGTDVLLGHAHASEGKQAAPHEHPEGFSGVEGMRSKRSWWRRLRGA